MTQMETVQIQVSSELARRLRPYQRDLPRILEWGLRHVERETEAETRAESTSEAMALQKRVVAALRRAGAVGPDPAEVEQYLAQPENQRWTPIQAGGKPASEMIIEERDSRPWARW
jgi:hypothetical protein